MKKFKKNNKFNKTLFNLFRNKKFSKNNKTARK